MPIIHGKSKRSFQKNVSTFYRDFRARGYSKGKAQKMAVAASFETQRAARRKARS